jgi:hypothetical protein
MLVMSRSLLFAAFACMSSFSMAQAPAATPAAQPRKGEAELKEALKGLASRGSFEATVAKYTGSGGVVQNEFDGAMLLSWKSPEAYRMQYQGMWGDTLLVIREGDSILTDGLELGAEAALRTAPPAFNASWQASGGESMIGPYPILFTGESALTLIAPASGTLEMKSAGTWGRIFTTTGSRFGTLSFQVSSRQGVWNLDWVQTSRSFGGGFGGSLIRMETAKITSLPNKTPEFWRAAPEKGVSVVDFRDKTIR